ncbi:MAG: hypothetical protein EBT03_05780 [Betaproteobacteria bacterium]|nr:hypothetical protein [Betaproteobacteria bacterium]NBT74849.1 hypothetical protein [Betaproteobacteria bacterium]NCA16865.1 hypothetical protein [Betaproteobacteria bacterium]
MTSRTTRRLRGAQLTQGLAWLSLVLGVSLHALGIFILPSDDPLLADGWQLLVQMLRALADVGIYPDELLDWSEHGIPLLTVFAALTVLLTVWSTICLVSIPRESDVAPLPIEESEATHLATLERQLFAAEEELGRATAQLESVRASLLNVSLDPHDFRVPEDLAQARAALDDLEDSLDALRGGQHALMASLVTLADHERSL